MALDPASFVAELDSENRRALERIGAASAAGEVPEELSVVRLLTLALKNELEATECAAAWIGTSNDVGVKLALARQAGDEAKHYRLLQERLAELGVDTRAHDPLAAGRSPLLSYLLGLEDVVARVAAGPFTREALALVRNAEFIRFCEARAIRGRRSSTPRRFNPTKRTITSSGEASCFGSRPRTKPRPRLGRRRGGPWPSPRRFKKWRA